MTTYAKINPLIYLFRNKNISTFCYIIGQTSKNFDFSKSGDVQLFWDTWNTLYLDI
jgi:hypothetical protein